MRKASLCESERCECKSRQSTQIFIEYMSNRKYKKYHLQKRLFLSRKAESAGYVIAIVEDTRQISDEDENEDWKWGHIDLSIGNDYQQISLNFSMETPEERIDSLHQIRRLAKTLCQFRDALELEAKSINARKSRRELQNEKSGIIEISTVA